MRNIYFIFSLFSLLHLHAEVFAFEENATQRDPYDITIIDSIHTYISADVRYNYSYVNKDQMYFVPNNLPVAQNEFTFNQIFNNNYPTLSLTLMQYVFVEQSLLPKTLLELNSFSSFDHFLFSSVVYNYEHLQFVTTAQEVYDYRSHAIFYGIYVWETEIETIKKNSFSRASTADTLTVTDNRQGLFLSQIWRNMFNFVGMMTHSPEGIAFSNEIDKLPISFWHMTFLPIIASDIYFKHTQYDYSKNATTLYSENADGFGLNFGAGFYLFSFDLFRTHYLNASFLFSFYYSLGQEFYTMNDGTLKGTAFYNQTNKFTIDSFISISF